MKKIGVGQVSSIEQDNDGFIWLGTYQKGLFRYDGTNLTNYHNQHLTNDSLTFVGIRGLSFDVARKIIWVVTDKYIYEFNPRTGLFSISNIYNDIPDLINETPHCIAIDDEGNKWISIGQNKLIKISNSGKTTANYYPIEEKIESFSAHIILINNQHPKTIYLLGKGMVSYNEHNQQITKLKSIPNSFSYLHNLSYRSAHLTKNGKLFLGSWAEGLFIHDIAKGTMEHYNQSLNNDGRQTIRTIYPINEDEYYISTALGLQIFNSTKKEIRIIQKNTSIRKEEYGVSYITKNGIIFNTGIYESYQYNPIENQFKHYLKPTNNYIYNVICNGLVEHNQYIYSAYYGGSGIYKFDKSNERWSLIPTLKLLQNAHDEYTDIQTMIQYDENHLLSVHTNHITKVKIPDGPVTIHPTTANFDNPLFKCITKDNNQDYWLGTRTKQLIQLSNDLKIKNIFKEQLTSTGPQPKNIWIDWINKDVQGRIWFRNEQGYGVTKVGPPISIEQVHYSKKSKKNFYSISGILEDRENNMWIFSESIGKVNHTSQTFDVSEIISDPNGIPYSFSNGIQLDSSRLALSNNNIYLLNTQTNNIEHFPETYGYQGIRLNGPWIKLKNGKIAIGHEKGFSIINPKSIHQNEEIPQPYLYNIRANNKDIPFSTALQNQTKITLPKGTNFISLTFASLAYQLSDQTTYQYRFANSDWIDTGKETEINLSPIKSGNNQFMLRAANNEGQHADKPYQLTIHVSKYWYETLSLKVLTGLLLAALIFSLYRWRKKVHLEKSHWQLQKSALELKALRAQMNPHFIYNCLNAIDTLILQEDIEKASTYLQTFAKLIRILLEQSRQEKISIADDTQALRLYVEMENLRFDQKIKFVITVDDQINQDVVYIPPLLVQPFVENAIRHGISSKKQGTIAIFYRKISTMVEIEISDDGVGRQQTKKNMNQNKIKLGTRITEERLKLIKQQFNQDLHIEIKDLYEKGKAVGTTIILQTPSLSYE